MIALADSLSAEHANEKALAESVLSRLHIEALERGWKGTFLCDAEWITDLMTWDGDLALKHDPICLIVIGRSDDRNGHGQVGLAEVRERMREKKYAAQKRQTEGRLL